MQKIPKKINKIKIKIPVLQKINDCKVEDTLTL